MLVARIALDWGEAVTAWSVVAAVSLEALAAMYLLTLAVAAATSRPRRPPPCRDLPLLAVLVPAHDEEALVARCVASLLAQDYPGSLFQVVVVADNCTDGTADVAAHAGARVLVRDDPRHRGKGHALRWGSERLLAEDPFLDAVVVVDADSVADPGLLSGLAARFRAGADVVQGEYLALEEDHSARALLRSAAFMLFHRVRFSGRAALGMPCFLVGNGMLFSRRVLRDHPWSAFSSVEDLEYSLELGLAGIDVDFAPDARVRAPVAGGGEAARTQRMRWEGGRFHVVRRRLPRLIGSVVRGGGLPALYRAVDVMVPPLGILAVTTGVMTLASVALVITRVLPPLAVMPGAVGLAAVAGFVLTGLWAGHAPPATYRALAMAPLMVATDMASRLRLVRGAGADRWVRTPRPAVASAAAVASPPAHDRYWIAGVPVDPLSMGEAVDVLGSAMVAGPLTQVCTVNLDFLTNACRDESIRQMLAASDVNLPDGAPVVWLGRLLGHRVPGRVAGSDLVVPLLGTAAARGARVFLLGGEGGVAEEAARRLREQIPDLVVAGTHAPDRRSQWDDEGIVKQINDAGTDLLLVALGHPKQDRWIADHRAALSVGVAMGVGCTFDLLAGRRSRAPRWMQATGLEWLHRAVHEPRRLGGRYARDAWCLAVVLVPDALRRRRRTRSGGHR